MYINIIFFIFLIFANLLVQGKGPGRSLSITLLPVLTTLGDYAVWSLTRSNGCQSIVKVPGNGQGFCY